MLVAPIAVASWTAFVEFRVCVTEDEPDIEVWVLFPYEQMFASVIDRPSAFALDEKSTV